VPDAKAEKLQSIYQELCAGAEAEGNSPPQLEDVRWLMSLLEEPLGEVAIPEGLPATLREALVEAARTAGVPAMRQRPGLRALLRLLWAEARFLPLAFFALQAVLLAVAFIANRSLAGFAGRTSLAVVPEAGLLMGALVRRAVGTSADAFVLVAPWLGAGVALVAALPRPKGLWADLEALSPFSAATRLLARTAVATAIAVVATCLAGLAEKGPTAGTVLLLARIAPLTLAVSWALAWSVPFGAAGASAASLALWGGLSLFGGALGRWNLLAPAPAGPAQVTALALSAILLAISWMLSHRTTPRARGSKLAV